MIFIEPVSKLHSRKELKHDLRRNNEKKSLISRDSVDLSEEANYLDEFILTSNGVYSLTAKMSCTVLILQAAVNAICGKDFPVRSIQELNHPEKEWQLGVQPPPIETIDAEEVYSDKNATKDSDSLTYKLIIPVLSNNDQKYEFQLTIRCNRLFAKKHYWPIPPKETTARLVSAPYSAHFISELPAPMLFEFDDDGEPDQLKELQKNTYDNEGNSVSSPSLFKVAGLRVWFEDKNAMKLYILGDTNLGAIFVENVQPQQQDTHQEEATTIRRSTSSHLDIEV